MAIRKVEFVNNEHYHIVNRGIDKREIFMDINDLARFFQGMEEFNTIDSIGSIYQNSFHQLRCKAPKQKKLVNFICYSLNPNHFHFILEQLVDKGIEKFMHKIGGYSKYFNYKYGRSGSLFQGKFKAVHIDSDAQLLHTSVYVNLNNQIHSLRCKAPKLGKTSWGEYIGTDNNFCQKDIVLGQFANLAEYKKFAENSIRSIRERKEVEKFLLE